MQEGRAAPRYPVTRAIERWWETGEVLPAWLENFRMGGALVRVDGGSPQAREVSVCRHGPEGPVSVEGTIIDVRKRGGWMRRGPLAIRTQFAQSCAYDFFKDDVFAWAPPETETLGEYESYWR
jgi:hypothetical protein